jgi:hypothetical protein
MLLARCQDLSLFGHLLYSAQDYAISGHEAVDEVLNFGVGAELLHKPLQFAKVMTWDAREKMVHCLKL